MNHCPVFELLIIFMLRLFSRGSAQCTLGQYFIGLNDCRGCPANTYMDILVHKQKKCFDCTVYEDPNAVVDHLCNATHDTVFRCADGYFNSDGHPMVCQHCRSCEYVARECSSVEDTICCPREGMMLQERMDNRTCEVESIGNTKYCCIEKSISYGSSTVHPSSSKNPTGQGNVSFVTTEKDSSSSILRNASDELDNSNNVSRSDNEPMSDGTLAVIIAGSIVGAIVIIVAVILCLLCIKSKCLPFNVKIMKWRKNKKLQHKRQRIANVPDITLKCLSFSNKTSLKYDTLEQKMDDTSLPY